MQYTREKKGEKRFVRLCHVFDGVCQVAAMFARMDVDHDGKIGFNEVSTVRLGVDD